MAVHCNTLSRLRQENREFWTVGPSLKTSKPQKRKRKRGIKARRKEVKEKEERKCRFRHRHLEEAMWLKNSGA